MESGHSYRVSFNDPCSIYLPNQLPSLQGWWPFYLHDAVWPSMVVDRTFLARGPHQYKLLFYGQHRFWLSTNVLESSWDIPNCVYRSLNQQDFWWKAGPRPCVHISPSRCSETCILSFGWWLCSGLYPRTSCLAIMRETRLDLGQDDEKSQVTWSLCARSITDCNLLEQTSWLGYSVVIGSKNICVIWSIILICWTVHALDCGSTAVLL